MAPTISEAFGDRYGAVAGRFSGNIIGDGRAAFSSRSYSCRPVAVHHAPRATALHGRQESADTPARWGIARGKLEAWQSGGAVVLRRRDKRLKWRAAALAGALCAIAVLSTPGVAQAQGFFDFLFGGPQRQAPPPPNYPPPPPEIGRIEPAPLGQERVNENAGTTGHGVAFCVRLCDGQHFPLERMANATPAETCKAICPTSVTKVYFGSEIEGAVAGDGARYSDLNTAFLYRKHLVANCGCNGKDPFGLATLE